MGNDYSYGAAVLRPGTSLNGGYYVIESKIGEGGFGITYKAVQKKLNRTVCIKEYFLMGRCARDTQNNRVVPNPSDTALYNKYRDSFTKEAQTLGELHHPGIVEIIDVFDENGTSYMVMPFIEGESLQSIVERQGPLPHSLAINYMAQISDAVSYIHRRHILHRDIKPANIMITGDYKAVLIDFGSAREFEHDKTQAQTSLLTLGYAPLEQYTTTSRKGSYTDIYAMGATFYFILTGRVPLAAAARVTERMPEPSELNPQIPSSVNHAIMKAMELQSRDRYQSVEEFTRNLQIHGPAHPTTSNPTRLQSSRPTENTSQPKRNNKWVVWMLVGIITLLVTVAAIALAIPRGNKAMDSVTDSTPANSTGDEYIGNDADDQDSHGRGGNYMKPDNEEIYNRQEEGEKAEVPEPAKVNIEYETPDNRSITSIQSEEEIDHLEQQLAEARYLVLINKHDAVARLIPSDIDIDNRDVMALVSAYNSRVLDLKAYRDTPRSPVVKSIQNELINMRSSMNRILEDYIGMLQERIANAAPATQFPSQNTDEELIEQFNKLVNDASINKTGRIYVEMFGVGNESRLSTAAKKKAIKEKFKNLTLDRKKIFLSLVKVIINI